MCNRVLLDTSPSPPVASRQRSAHDYGPAAAEAPPSVTARRCGQTRRRATLTLRQGQDAQVIVVWHTNRSWRQLCAGPGRMPTGLPLASQFDEFARLFHMVADALNAMFVIAHYRSSSLPAPRTKCIDAVHLSPVPCTHGMKSSAGPGLKIHRSQRQGHCTAEAIV